MSPPSLLADNDAGFKQFWSLYPRREAKKSAYKAWSRIRPDEALVEIICKAVAQQTKTQFSKSEKRFIPLAATWLNGERWRDEATTASATKPVESSKAPSQYSDAAMLSEYSERFKAQREWVKNHWTKPVDED